MITNDSELLARFSANLPGAVFTYSLAVDGTDEVVFMNDYCTVIWGKTASEIQNDPAALWDMVLPEDLPKMRESVLISAETLTHWEYRFRIVNGRGKPLNLLARGIPRRGDDGTVVWLTFIFDVTYQTETEQKMREVSQHLSIVSDAMPDALALFDANEVLVHCNARFQESHGFSAEDTIVGLTITEILEFAVSIAHYPDAIGCEAQWVAETLATFRRGTGVTEVKYNTDSWLRHLDRPTRDGGRISIRIEISDTKRQQSELEVAATTDLLTGLLNRRGLSIKLDEAICNLGPDETLALIHLDLDKFKTINDAMGHDAGDFVLKTVAQRLSQAFDHRSVVARTGGDEFAIAVPVLWSDEEVMQIADKLRLSVSEEMMFHDRLCQVGASIGIARRSTMSRATMEQCLLDADTALMKAKAFGRNRTVMFYETMRSEALCTAKNVADIKLGLDREQFEPFFQPQIDMSTGQVSGFEALVRWRTDDGGLRSPDSFIETAMESGLIAAIDRVVLHESLDALPSLTELMHVPPKLSLNMSSVRLRDAHVVDELLETLHGRGIPSSQIALEILETTLLDDRNDGISRNIRKLADAGFQIELDDFGTGHTALANLLNFPVHRIKIDRSLVSRIDVDKKKRAVVEGVFELCKKLDVAVIAEGVETKSELRTMQDLGISHFQGFYFAKPMATAEVKEWLMFRYGDGVAAESMVQEQCGRIPQLKSFK